MSNKTFWGKKSTEGKETVYIIIVKEEERGERARSLS